MMSDPERNYPELDAPLPHVQAGMPDEGLVVDSDGSKDTSSAVSDDSDSDGSEDSSSEESEDTEDS